MIYKIIDGNNKVHELPIEKILELIKKNPSNKFYKYIYNEKIEICNTIVCNTQFICHRINKVVKLNNINTQFGIELDIRDDYESGELILAHDPFTAGEKLSDYLKKYNHHTLILNIKSERIEFKCLDLLKKYHIQNYFFLDSSFPMIYLLNKEYQNNNIACRFSEFENIDFFLQNKNMFSTVWVDCFTQFPLNTKIYNTIKKENKQICLVSPELQRQPEKIQDYRNYIIKKQLI